MLLASSRIGIELIQSGSEWIPEIIYFNGATGHRPLLSSSLLTIHTTEKYFSIPILSLQKKENRILFQGNQQIETGHFDLQGDFEIHPGEVATIRARIRLKYSGKDSVKVRLESTWKIQDTGIPRWMVPGIFYKHNRPPQCVTLYPAYHPDDGDHNLFVSDHWSFRSDRTTAPAVFGWTEKYSSALLWNSIQKFSAFASDKNNPLNQNNKASNFLPMDDSGIGFRGDPSGNWVSLYYPFIEEPVRHTGYGRGTVYQDYNGIAPEARFLEILPGEEIEFIYSIYTGAYDLHIYNPLLRDLYKEYQPLYPLQPWMPKSTASALTAYGLIHWLYDENEHVLYETCAFDSYFGKGKKQVDRPHMHISWVSGIPYAYGLYRYAREGNVQPEDKEILKEENDFINPARKIIDKITREGFAPCGFFYPQWTKENGWDCGWNPQPNWIQSRTIAEGTLFLLRTIQLVKQHNETVPLIWIDSAKKNLNLIIKLQNIEGNFGSYYDKDTGMVMEWEGEGGILWISALFLASELFDENKYRDSALRAATYYKKFIDDEYIYGAPEDVHLCPTSEDGYNAVMAYVWAYQTTKDSYWLDYSKKAADWMLTWRFIYNHKFPEHTILEKYDFRTRGGDIASPSNQHTHNYGLVCTPEILKLWEWTGDDYYLERLKDHLFCFLQFIARRNGDFGAQKGMVTERWFHTDWDHSKGDLLALAHTWCAGLILYSNLCIHQFGDILIDMDKQNLYVLESTPIRNIQKEPEKLAFSLENPYYRTLDLSIGVYHFNTKYELILNEEIIPLQKTETVEFINRTAQKDYYSINIKASSVSHIRIQKI